MDREQTFERFGRHVSPGKVRTYTDYGLDVVMGRREGIRFWDRFSDRSWINCHCNGGVFNLGHRNAGVREAVRAALDHLDIGNHHLVSEQRAVLASRLAASTDGHLDGVVFGVSGGEAVDLALKVCRWSTGRQRIVSVHGGYHGHTGLALAAGDPAYRDPFGPNLPGFEQIPFDDLDAVDAVLDETVAAVIVEPVPATLGMPIAQPGYLKALEERAHAVGAKLIVDEVQTGLGRTGTMWCYQHEDVRPDALVTGKGLSGSIYPITATLMTPELHGLFAERPFVHVSTFGGSELGCVAALAVLDQVQAPGFLDHVNALAERFRVGLSDLPFTLRQKGLMMALKFNQEDAGLFAARMLYEQGIFTVYAGNNTSALQFLPPLVLTEDEADEIIAVIRRTWGQG